MLQFLRKHQRYFFFIIAVVIISSFSFFGTYSAIGTADLAESPRLETASGEQINKKDFDTMVFFLSSEKNDSFSFGRNTFSNFLNEGIISRDILDSGLYGVIKSEALAEENNPIKNDFISKLKKEKYFRPYTHPANSMISAEGAWSYFSPQMKENLAALKEVDRKDIGDLFDIKTSLFMGQKRLPPSILGQILRYQEKEFASENGDENLPYQDLSLFGYHSIEDWFGKAFIEKCAEIILKGASYAEKIGYEVKDVEVALKLQKMAEEAFKASLKQGSLSVSSSEEYLEVLYRSLGIDQKSALKILKKIELFHRMLVDIKQGVIVSPYLFSYDTNQEILYQGDYFLIDTISKEPSTSFEGLVTFEAYLDLISERQENKILPPKRFYTVEEVAAKNPLLIEERFLVAIKKLNKQILFDKIALKEVWAKEVDEAVFKELQENFPFLRGKVSLTQEDREQALATLSKKEGMQVDLYVKNLIVQQHPEWIESSLSTLTPEVIELFISEEGYISNLPHAKKGKELTALLNSKEPLKKGLTQEDLPKVIEELKKEDFLVLFEPDDFTIYQIALLEKNKDKEIMSFAEVWEGKILKDSIDTKLQNFYIKMREGSPSTFQERDGNWKDFHEVKEEVCKRKLSPLFLQVESFVKEHGVPNYQEEDLSGSYSSEELLSYRFLPFYLYPIIPLESFHEKELFIQDKKVEDQFQFIKVPGSLDLAIKPRSEAFKKSIEALTVNKDKLLAFYPNKDLCYFAPTLREETTGFSDKIIEEVKKKELPIQKEALNYFFETVVLKK